MAVGATDYGNLGLELHRRLASDRTVKSIELHKTKMAGGISLETNEDLLNLITEIKKSTVRKVVFIVSQICDWYIKPLEWVPVPGDTKILLATETGDTEKRIQNVWPRRSALQLNPLKVEDNPLFNVKAGKSPRDDFLFVAFDYVTSASDEELQERISTISNQSGCDIGVLIDLHTNRYVIFDSEARMSGDDRKTMLIDLVEKVKTLYKHDTEEENV